MALKKRPNDIHQFGVYMYEYVVGLLFEDMCIIRWSQT